MGDQVNLIAIDGTLQYQFPIPIVFFLAESRGSIRGIAYQVLSRYCERTLSNALAVQHLADGCRRYNENRLRWMGLMPISFTFTALHPPVTVARDYQSVVSAPIDQKSTVIRAHAYRIKSIPRAKIEAEDAKKCPKRCT